MVVHGFPWKRLRQCVRIVHASDEVPVDRRTNGGAMLGIGQRAGSGDQNRVLPLPCGYFFVKTELSILLVGVV